MVRPNSSVDRHGGRRNRTIETASYGVVVPDDRIAIRPSRPATAAGLSKDARTVDDGDRTAHALTARRRSTASP